MSYKTSDFALYLNPNFEEGSANYTDDCFIYLNQYVSSLSLTIPFNSREDYEKYDCTITRSGSSVNCDGYVDGQLKLVTANIVLSNASKFLRMVGFNDGFLVAQIGKFVDLASVMCWRYEFRMHVMLQGLGNLSSGLGGIKEFGFFIRSCTHDQEKDQVTFDCVCKKFHLFQPASTSKYHILTNEINQQKAQTVMGDNQTKEITVGSGSTAKTYKVIPFVKNEKTSAWGSYKFGSAHSLSSLGCDISPQEKILLSDGMMCTTGIAYMKPQGVSWYTIKNINYLDSITVNWNANVWGEISYTYENQNKVVVTSTN